MLFTLLTYLALAAPLDAPPLPGEPLGAWGALEDEAPIAVLTADEAVARALAHNKELSALLTEVDRAGAERLAARAMPNPSAELGLVEGGHVGVGSLEVDFALTEALLTPLRARPAGAALDAASFAASAEMLRFEFTVRAALYEAQAATARYQAAARAVDAWAAAAETARALYEAGNVPELDVAVQEAEYARARVGLDAVALELVAAREHLARLVGGPVFEALAPLPRPAPLDLPDDLEARAVAASLELRARDARVQGANAAWTHARVDAFVPDVGLFVGSARHEQGWSAEAGVHLEVPLFALGRGEIGGYDAQRRAERDLRAQAEIEVRSAAREAQARLISAHDRAEHFAQVVVPARERVSRQTLLQYNAMQVSVFQLLEARRAELEAQATLADLLAERAVAQAALDALLAGVRVDAPRITAPPSGAASAAGGH